MPDSIKPFKQFLAGEMIVESNDQAKEKYDESKEFADDLEVVKNEHGRFHVEPDRGTVVVYGKHKSGKYSHTFHEHDGSIVNPSIHVSKNAQKQNPHLDKEEARHIGKAVREVWNRYDEDGNNVITGEPKDD